MKFRRKALISIVMALAIIVSTPSINTFADTVVYVTKTGTKYHYSRNCKGLNNAKTIIETTLSSAQSSGHTACSLCATNSSSSDNSSTSESNSSTTTSSTSSQSDTVSENIDSSIKSTSIIKLTSTKKETAIVKWKKITNDGYEIQYSTTKSFKKAVKTINVKKYSTVTRTIKKLKSNKKYYFRIRTYKYNNGIKNYSEWSKIKKIKIK